MPLPWQPPGLTHARLKTIRVALQDSIRKHQCGSESTFDIEKKLFSLFAKASNVSVAIRRVRSR